MTACPCGKLFYSFNKMEFNKMENVLKNKPLSAAEHLRLEEILKNEPLGATEHLEMGKVLKSEPLSATDHLKIMIFLPLLIPSVFPYLLGIIPVLLLAFGYYMMKKNRDFSSLEVSVKTAKNYYKIVIFLSFLAAAFGLFSYLNYDYDGSFSRAYYSDYFATFLIASLVATIAFAYILILKHLYFLPLQNHSEWVVANGTFSNKPKKPTPDNSKASVDILQSEKLKPYSVADELLKWAKLKEDGLISEEEFNEARSKLLNRS